MKADKRKHLLTCHYEGQRRARAVARLREHLAPRCWEGGGQKKRKEAGFSARQPGGLIHGPRDFAPVSGGLRDAPPVRVAHTRAHTHARSPARRQLPAQRTSASTPRPGRAGAGAGECAPGPRGCALGGGSAAGHRLGRQQAGSRRDFGPGHGAAAEAEVRSDG